MDRDELLHYLNQYLEIGQFDDSCQNGLQVEGMPEVHKVALGVSVSARLFQEAVAFGAEMIIVHHGLFWQKDPHPYQVTGFRKRRLALLLQNDVNLLAYHLPLDAHGEVGNNIQILQRLQLAPLEAMEIGFIGSVRTPVEIEELHDRVNGQLQTSATLFPFGTRWVEKVLVISGSSSAACERAFHLGVDTFIGGDIREDHVRLCEELGLNFIAAGHYNSEKFGVQALADHIQQKFGLTTKFFDIPNPV